MSEAELKMLPNGETTTDVEEYIKTWEEFAAVIVEITGWTLHSYDPKIVLLRPNSICCIIDVSIVKIINDLVLENAGLKLQMEGVS